jgi:hypothetical protein
MRNVSSNPATAPIETPVRTPSIDPNPAPWPERFTDPIHICPQQKRELTSPDVAP